MTGNSIAAVDKDPSLLDRIATRDEKLCFLYDLHNPREEIGNPWKSPQTPRRQFQSEDEVKSASQAGLKEVAKNEFQKCFDDLYKRWIMCVVAQGSYLEGRCISAI
ncbi:hypothetical protein TNCV_2147911 [Trichonephila clavipes]|uniref:Uncharacterized protein n=1 Tax=Trichonephila clavipes TaxID=2585209 RepID=A0A8X6SYR3_TRICX|nr:hypothetical protein TNCV_2147911 [Trichonephila clavipes]